MSRIFWDSMLIIYLLEGNPAYSKRVQHLLRRSYERGDSLFTSFLAYGEVMAGAVNSPEKAGKIQRTMEEMGFGYLPFDAGAVMPFSRLRAKNKLKVADSIHLASAASAGIDLFLTGDKQLMGLDVPGVQFIADFNTPLL
ncbi:PIN domain-containing protein [Tunturiibacter empetritectus]|uniref:Nucleic acid-binding protein n=1 Tax=Tunturiibacter lichenicola TaxID=2051959 RepID=A0A852VJ38_9BACT|nr:PIN domain-containing protein [Edaphobacter lichenicola]NYF89516.1 putative nucleic acid-binding protein [Edaphobacter lichenicola]